MNYSRYDYRHTPPASLEGSSGHDYQRLEQIDDDKLLPALIEEHDLENNLIATVDAVEQPMDGIFQPHFSLGITQSQHGQMEMVLVQNPGKGFQVDYEGELTRQPLLDGHPAIEEIHVQAPRIEQPRQGRPNLTLAAIKASCIATGGASMIYGLYTLTDPENYSENTLTKALIHVGIGTYLILCSCHTRGPRVLSRLWY